MRMYGILRFPRFFFDTLQFVWSYSQSLLHKTFKEISFRSLIPSRLSLRASFHISSSKSCHSPGRNCRSSMTCSSNLFHPTLKCQEINRWPPKRQSFSPRISIYILCVCQALPILLTKASTYDEARASWKPFLEASSIMIQQDIRASRTGYDRSHQKEPPS